MFLTGPPWRALRGAPFPVITLSGGGGLSELSRELGTLTDAMVDPEAIFLRAERRN